MDSSNSSPTRKCKAEMFKCTSQAQIQKTRAVEKLGLIQSKKYVYGTQEDVGIAPVENHVPLRSDAKRIVSLTLNTQCQFVRSPGHSSGLQWSLLGLHASSHHREGGRECVDIGDDVNLMLSRQFLQRGSCLHLNVNLTIFSGSKPELSSLGEGCHRRQRNW